MISAAIFFWNVRSISPYEFQVGFKFVLLHVLFPFGLDFEFHLGNWHVYIFRRGSVLFYTPSLTLLSSSRQMPKNALFFKLKAALLARRWQDDAVYVVNKGVICQKKNVDGGFRSRFLRRHNPMLWPLDHYATPIIVRLPYITDSQDDAAPVWERESERSLQHSQSRIQSTVP